MLKAEAILFDLDGTLWDSSKGVLDSWNEVVKRRSDVKRGLITKEELDKCFGLPMTEIADRLFTNCSEEEKADILEECCRVENDYLREHGGILFPKLRETLLELKKEYKLFVVSNCQSGYIEAFMHAHNLEEIFDDTQCWGDNKVPKGENNKFIMERNHVTRAVYVGDTDGDENSARVAGIPFVFAAYGFGKAVKPDYTIDAFEELVKKMEQVTF